MKSILTDINRRIPFPLLLISMFICLDLLIYFLMDLILALVEYFFLRNDVFQANTQTLLAFLMGKSISLIIIGLFSRPHYFELDSYYTSNKFATKNIVIVIIISMASLIVLKHEIVNIFIKICGEIQTNLIYWPNLILKPSSDDVFYLFLFILVFVIIQPVWEEIIFRRILINTLIKRGFNQNLSIILSSFAFSFYLTIFIMVEISTNDLRWYLITSIFSGIVLGTIYIKTYQIKYNLITSSLVNLSLLFLYLSGEDIEFAPYRMIILIFSFLPVLFTFFITFYYITRKYLSRKIFISSLKRNLQSSLLISWPKSVAIKNYWYTIFFVLPILPFGGIIFIDHTILYTDIWALIIQNALITILLILILFYSYFHIHPQLNPNTDTIMNTRTISISTIKAKFALFNKESVKNIPEFFISRITLLILLIGILSPFYILHVTSFTKIEIIIIWQALVDVSITIAQSPFFTFQQVINEIRSNIVFIGNKTEEIYQFLPFQQSLGQWNFLPDTYMVSEADWVHGLLTVLVWFGIIIFCFYIIRKGNKYPLRTVLGIVLLIILNFFWILLALGFGSITEQGGPSTVPALNQTSLIVQFNITVKEFMILPIGLIFLLISAILIALRLYFHKNKPEKNNNKIIL